MAPSTRLLPAPRLSPLALREPLVSPPEATTPPRPCAPLVRRPFSYFYFRNPDSPSYLSSTQARRHHRSRPAFLRLTPLRTPCTATRPPRVPRPSPRVPHTARPPAAARRPSPSLPDPLTPLPSPNRLPRPAARALEVRQHHQAKRMRS